ncbi:MAG: MFS transporter [Corynebacterium sp.]|uniref:MFS transporter n=1 Tax=Corynebacterium sp. TaxID=1720 RepID=UPI0026DC1ECD|nr:MFS transporter [Corynebacterium sp.]MDO4761033.1 MFS transporter [Corynebacterium sp.]
MTSCTPTEPCEVPSSEIPDFSATRRTDKTTVLCWALWDMGSAAFNAVLVTFVFSVYLISSVGENINSRFSASSWYSLAIAAGGIAIALLAPVLGQRSDARGTRRKSVRRWTTVTFLLMLTLFFIRDDAPMYFWVGISIMAIASVTYELAEVSYFAMLNQISTEKNVGRISGFGWSLGYFGGIILLAICYFGFIAGDGGLFAFPTEGGFNVRMVAIFAAAWFIIFCLPVMFRVPEVPPNPSIMSGGVKTSYVELFRTIATLWRKQRSSVFFLISSAIFRDGVAAVFTFGAILAVSVFGLSASDVLVFGIAANLIAGFGALGAGYLDDKFGPKPVILVSLVSMVITAGILFVVEGPKNFWIFGLILCLFVGPIQSSSRTFLSRMAPAGHEGQMFGLYATTGRAVSWLAPLAFTAFVWIFGTDRAGILGIGLVLLAGAGVLIFVREPRPALAPFEDTVKA